MVAAGLDIWNPGEDGGSLPGQEEEVLEAVRMCVELGNDVNAANDLQETALHGAAFRGANIVVEYLVEQGARLDARDQNGWIPWAVAYGFSYSDFYKAQRHTAALLAEYMEARGISTDGETIPGSVCFDCLQTRRDQSQPCGIATSGWRPSSRQGRASSPSPRTRVAPGRGLRRSSSRQLWRLLSFVPRCNGSLAWQCD